MGKRSALIIAVVISLVIDAGYLSFAVMAESIDLQAEGFTGIKNYREDEIDITVYYGVGSSEKAIKVFTNWAENEGWKPLDNDQEIIYTEDYPGKAFEKEDETLFINPVETELMVTVLLIRAPREIKAGEMTAVKEIIAKVSGEEELVEEDFYSFKSIADLSRHFKELGLTFDNYEINYLFIGSAEIEGIPSEHLKIESEDDCIELWIKVDSSEILRILIDDQEIKEEEFFIGEIYLKYLQLFFAGHGWNKEWSAAERSQTVNDFGSGPTFVSQLEYDMSSRGIPQIIEIETVKISGKNLLCKYRTYDMDGNLYGGWQIHRIIAR